MSGVNANRKYALDLPWKLSISVPESLRVAIDTARGDQSRTAWVIAACMEYLKRSQAA